MRKIKINPFPKVKSDIPAEPSQPNKTRRANRITFALNSSLCQQAENWLNSQWVQQNYAYSGLSELIRKSLTAYQEGEIEINLTERDKNAPKREITIRFFNNPDLLNFYYSLPLDKISQESKELEKYRK